MLQRHEQAPLTTTVALNSHTSPQRLTTFHLTREYWTISYVPFHTRMVHFYENVHLVQIRGLGEVMSHKQCGYSGRFKFIERKILAANCSWACIRGFPYHRGKSTHDMCASQLWNEDQWSGILSRVLYPCHVKCHKLQPETLEHRGTASLPLGG